jgi:hypothetical protein
MKNYACCNEKIEDVAEVTLNPHSLQETANLSPH